MYISFHIPLDFSYKIKVEIFFVFFSYFPYFSSPLKNASRYLCLFSHHFNKTGTRSAWKNLFPFVLFKQRANTFLAWNFFAFFHQNCIFIQQLFLLLLVQLVLFAMKSHKNVPILRVLLHLRKCENLFHLFSCCSWLRYSSASWLGLV